jgi:glucosyl-dolichyl phosphate glucuronosyltransferase
LKILLAICTFNRSHLLQQTLARLTEIDRPLQAQWGVLVVNNACTDDTEAVLARFRDKLPLNAHYEAKKGLSNARNAAAEQAKALGADYIIWTDDDVLPEKNWLRAYEEAFRTHPEAAVFGGPVDPWFAAAPPQWILRNWDLISNTFAVKDLGDEKIPLCPSGPNIPFGANFAIRMREQARKQYDPQLGVVGNKRLGGEETGVMRELLREGATGWWIPQARVKHYLEAERLCLNYVGRYVRGNGRTQGRVEGDPHSIFKKLWLVRLAVSHSARFAFFALARRERQWVNEYVEANSAWGRLLDSRG